mmetsp:Transcript_12695/g.29860  ORF Transcript_12695/g.29860 Transcript_12695/m.29860 type:complete len:283 (+) Transcript_12695:473-1321(+)
MASLLSDPVMSRLRAVFEPMRASFLVAYLIDPQAAEPFHPSPYQPRGVKAEAQDGTAGDKGENQPSFHSDPDEVIENDLCDTRQSFLNLCQANHFQFDQLRRAKYSTTMLCYSLHNPTVLAPNASPATMSFVGYGAAHGADDSFIGAAGGDNGAWIQGAPEIVGPEPTESAERRAAREKSILLHMRLLTHTSTCNSPQCTSQNCRKLKSLLRHSMVCPARGNKQVCHVCRRVYALLHIHARDCREDSCTVLHCRVFRERIRQTRRQQSQMDMRRRAAMHNSR